MSLPLPPDRGRVAVIVSTALHLLLTYQWPGNLRELSKVAQAAVALTTGDVIGVEVLRLLLDEDAASPAPPRAAAPHTLGLEAAVQAHIRYVLDLVGGNKRRAARELGVARATLERKLKEMGSGR